MADRVIPIWEKYTLTVKECAEYTNIGENKIRELILRDGDKFMLCVGNKRLIKRKAFEKYISEREYI